MIEQVLLGHVVGLAFLLQILNREDDRGDLVRLLRALDATEESHCLVDLPVEGALRRMPARRLRLRSGAPRIVYRGGRLVREGDGLHGDGSASRGGATEVMSMSPRGRAGRGRDR